MSPVRTKSPRRPWTRAEKLLVLAPLLVALGAGGSWLWQRMAPVSIDIPDANSLEAMRFSPDGTRLVVFYDSSSSIRHVVQVYDAASGKLIRELATPSVGFTPIYYRGPSWSPDGRRLVAGFDSNIRSSFKIAERRRTKNSRGFYYGQVGKLVMWDAGSGQVQRTFLYAPTNETSYGSVHFSEDGKTLISDGQPPSIFDAATGQRTQLIKGTFKRATYGQFNPRRGLWALLNEDYNQLQVFDPKTQQLLWQHPTSSSREFGWRGDVLGFVEQIPNIVGQRQGSERVKLWDAQSRSPLPSPPTAPRSFVTGLSLSRDNRTLAYFNFVIGTAPKTSSLPKRLVKGNLIAWDYRSNRELWRTEVNDDLYWIQWSPDGQWLSAVTSPTTPTPPHLLVFDRQGSLRLERQVESQIHLWSPDSRRIAFADWTPFAPVRIRMIRVGS